ncbi:MAG TPA: hypothetical protein VMM76_05430 [Pirellulaceae bacterium]|nr:hypothetical protein [Pirellulaceae bacterium]
MTTQHDKAKRWQFGLRWLFFVTFSVASGAWSWSLLYRPDPDAPLSLWELKRPLSREIFGCSLIGASVLGILLICNLFVKRWRPSFSVRTLAIVVTLVCCYAACWGPTKRQGVSDVRLFLTSSGFHSNVGEPCPIFPLLVTVNPASLGEMAITRGTLLRRYHFFWFFGYVIPLPL